MTSGLGQVSLNTSKEVRLINVNAKIPELITAFSRTQIFYEPNMGNFFTADSEFSQYSIPGPEGD